MIGWNIQGLQRRQAWLLVLTMVLAGGAAQADDAVDRLQLVGPLSYDGVDYSLAWSAQPTPGYYKQEYLPAGQRPATFSEMIIVEVLTSGADVNGAAAKQIEMLNERKANDPLVNYDLLQNAQSGEVILDFLVSGRTQDGSILVEWNAYRYAPHQNGDGASGVMLFGIARRGYGDQANEFLTELKSVRPDHLNAIAQHVLPRAQVQ